MATDDLARLAAACQRHSGNLAALPDDELGTPIFQAAAELGGTAYLASFLAERGLKEVVGVRLAGALYYVYCYRIGRRYRWKFYDLASWQRFYGRRAAEAAAPGRASGQRGCS